MSSTLVKFLSLTIICIVMIDDVLCHEQWKRQQSNETETEHTTREYMYTPCTSRKGGTGGGSYPGTYTALQAPRLQNTKEKG